MNWIGLRENNFGEMGIDIMSLLPSATGSLDFERCSMHRFPNHDVYISAIKNIKLSNNHLTELSFVDFRNLSNLETLKLDRNNLTTMRDLYNHSSLTTLIFERKSSSMWPCTVLDRYVAAYKDTSSDIRYYHVPEPNWITRSTLDSTSSSEYQFLWSKWCCSCPNAYLTTNVSYICVEVTAQMMTTFIFNV